MRSFVGIIIIILFVACTRNKSVQVSGRVETGDTVVYFQVNDSLHKFRLDEKHYFSGKIELEKGTYARFIPYSIQVFLTPGEDLEISMNNVRNVSNSLQFKGTLSAINLYLKEQQNRYFIYDPNLYKLNEKDFVNRMRENINTNIVLLEKNSRNRNGSASGIALRSRQYIILVVMWPLIHCINRGCCMIISCLNSTLTTRRCWPLIAINALF